MHDHAIAEPAHGRTPDPEKVTSLLRDIIGGMHGALTAKEAALLHEVEELARTLARARAEIAALQADDITASHIPSATDELDAIVVHTAAATNTILEACETPDSLAAGAQTDPNAVQDATTRIYEACSFQDITGQRISKVVTTLKAIEAKVAHIIQIFAPPPQAAREPGGDAGGEEASLLNGPQLPSQAMGQSDIDTLLASFD